MRNNELNDIRDLINQCMALLDRACELVPMSELPDKTAISGNLARAIGELLHARKRIEDAAPTSGSR
jgi:hypothetical protein